MFLLTHLEKEAWTKTPCTRYTLWSIRPLSWARCLFQVCGVSVLSFGIYLMAKFRVVALIPELANFNIANMLMVSGIIITCVSFLGFLGALKENRCLLIMVTHTNTHAHKVHKDVCIIDLLCGCWQYFLLLFLLMVVELTAACLLLVSDGQVGAGFIALNFYQKTFEILTWPLSSDWVKSWREACHRFGEGQNWRSKEFNNTEWVGSAPDKREILTYSGTE